MPRDSALPVLAPVRRHGGAGHTPRKPPAAQALALPLCVDLDRTLLLTDTLFEAILSLILRGLSWLAIPFWLVRGKAYLKRRIALSSPLDVSILPYNDVLLQELTSQHVAGRRIVLCTGAAKELATRVAAHLGIFDEVIATGERVNLVGIFKRDALEERFGRNGFDYIGDGFQDLPIWEIAHQSFVVEPSAHLRRALQRRGITVAGFYSRGATPSHGPKSWLRAIRIHQWAKNLLLFTPLALGHRPALIEAGFAFVAFCFTASAGYLLNDLLDLEADRRHAEKRRRPLAAAEIPLSHAAAAIPVLLLAACATALELPPLFRVTLAIYFGGSLLYSLWLKRQAPMDLILLAGLYTIRIAAGGAAAQIVISPWTLAVSVFLFLSLAMVKRVSELRGLSDIKPQGAPGRAYLKVDIAQLSAMGEAAGYCSVLVMALYIHSPDVEKLYKHPQWLWLILPIMLHWITRVWLLTGRGSINQDPVLFAVKDKTTYIAGLLSAALAALATI